MRANAPECFTPNEYTVTIPSSVIILCKSLSYNSSPPYVSPFFFTIALYFSFRVPVYLCALDS